MALFQAGQSTAKAAGSLKDFLESFSEPPIIGSIGSVFPNDPPPDYSGVVGQALAQVIGQKCDEIEPPG